MIYAIVFNILVFILISECQLGTVQYLLVGGGEDLKEGGGLWNSHRLIGQENDKDVKLALILRKMTENSKISGALRLNKANMSLNVLKFLKHGWVALLLPLK